MMFNLDKSLGKIQEYLHSKGISTFYDIDDVKKLLSMSFEFECVEIASITLELTLEDDGEWYITINQYSTLLNLAMLLNNMIKYKEVCEK